MKDKWPILLAIIIIVLVAWFVFRSDTPTENSIIDDVQIELGTTSRLEDPLATEYLRETCVNHEDELGMHIHAQLDIYVEGEQVEVPGNIGITEDCMRALHTHDADGVIHVEYPEEYTFYLEDFFDNWGELFSDTQLFNLDADDEHTITMYVNGEQNFDYEWLAIEDGQHIEIFYE